MSTALWPLQRAVHQRLTADPALMSMVSGVYDEVPETAAHPYVTFGSTTEVVDDAHNQRGLTTTLVLHIWSRYRGWREAADILAALDALLDRQPLAVTGWTDVSLAHQQHQQLRDPDPEIRHINVSYRVWLTKE
ncbi:DUF3168 domain-containing protein [Streptomyces sp. NPDC018031]|uniref:DUF3168 domain-containing protein n=1 Tax=Streptomyces sp. NPDC018031 TaxID=3365033 RepID=UPI00378CA6BE